MSIALLELAAATLGGLVDEVVFTGGATVGLWITDPAAPQPRPTEDVDVIVLADARMPRRHAEIPHRPWQPTSICTWLPTLTRSGTHPNVPIRATTPELGAIRHE